MGMSPPPDGRPFLAGSSRAGAPRGAARPARVPALLLGPHGGAWVQASTLWPQQAGLHVARMGRAGGMGAGETSVAVVGVRRDPPAGPLSLAKCFGFEISREFAIHPLLSSAPAPRGALFPRVLVNDFLCGDGSAYQVIILQLFFLRY